MRRSGRGARVVAHRHEQATPDKLCWRAGWSGRNAHRWCRRTPGHLPKGEKTALFLSVPRIESYFSITAILAFWAVISHMNFAAVPCSVVGCVQQRAPSVPRGRFVVTNNQQLTQINTGPAGKRGMTKTNAFSLGRDLRSGGAG